MELKRAFKVIYKSNLLINEAIAQLEADFDNPLVTEMLDFIKASERGICRYIYGNSEDKD
jgi:UDP-N-acetylglucosamine acyltransferase